MPGCAAVGCNNRSEKGYTMKCFPRDPALRTLWTEKVSRADWLPSNNSFLCHVHFDADQWIRTQSGRIKLKRNAVPTIFTVTSTRKSPRKRRKHANDATWFVEYLNDPLHGSALMKPRDTLSERFPTKIAPSLKSKRTMRGQKKQREAIVVSNDANRIAAENGILRGKNIAESEKISETKVKSEMKPQVESDEELDDIERKLRWICDGELQPEKKTKKEKIATNKNGKVVVAAATGVKIDEKLSRSGLNGEANDKEGNTRETVDGRRRSRREITRDIEKTLGAGKSLHANSDTKEKDEKPCVDLNPRESRFTIKVTGKDEDVSEIFRSLGSEPILKYKSKNESTRNLNGFVTSVISIVDHSTSKNGELLVPKVEVEESPNAETTNDWNWRENEYMKPSAESSNDHGGSTNHGQLRKKVKLQEEVVRTLKKESAESGEPPDTKDDKLKILRSDFLNSGTGEKGFAIKRSSRDDRSENDKLLKDLSERVVKLDEINKSLNKQFAEKNRQTKKLEWQIRQRDNRIKELNWKLEKASKYLERAEKNTNTYRKKMVNMQSLLARRKILELKNLSKVSSVARTEGNLPDVVKERCRDKDRNESEEDAVYETVQDIFDESNDCDDDPSVIDTREDFLREFEGAF